MGPAIDINEGLMIRVSSVTATRSILQDHVPSRCHLRVLDPLQCQPQPPLGYSTMNLSVCSSTYPQPYPLRRHDLLQADRPLVGWLRRISVRGYLDNLSWIRKVPHDHEYVAH